MDKHLSHAHLGTKNPFEVLLIRERGKIEGRGSEGGREQKDKPIRAWISEGLSVPCA